MGSPGQCVCVVLWVAQDTETKCTVEYKGYHAGCRAAGCNGDHARELWWLVERFPIRYILVCPPFCAYSSE